MICTTVCHRESGHTGEENLPKPPFLSSSVAISEAKKEKKEKEIPPTVASGVVLLIVPAPKAQSLAHGCRNKIMAAGGLQSRRQKPPEKQTEVWAGGSRVVGRGKTHISTYRDISKWGFDPAGESGCQHIYPMHEKAEKLLKSQSLQFSYFSKKVSRVCKHCKVNNLISRLRSECSLGSFSGRFLWLRKIPNLLKSFSLRSAISCAQAWFGLSFPQTSVAGWEPQEERCTGNTIWYIKSVWPHLKRHTPQNVIIPKRN